MFFLFLVITIFPWSDGLFVIKNERVGEGRSKCKIEKINPNDGTSITVLPGYHREPSPVHLTSMHAVMTPTGFLSSIGHRIDTSGSEVPCTVLISIGKGCKGPLQYSQLSDTKLDTYAILHVIT